MRTTLSRVMVVMMLAFALFVAGCQKSQITEENYGKIKVGMTLNQVENILGGKGDDQTSEAGVSIGNGGMQGGTSKPDNVYVWKSKDLKIVVICKDGKVVQLSKQAI